MSSIPVDVTREALAGLRREFEAARSHLMLDLPTAAGARVVESVALAVANARHDPDFDNDAYLRWIYHRFNLALAQGPQTERPALHMVAAAVASGALDEGFGEQIEAVAERELAEADKLVGAALDLSSDLDGFYWLLFAAALPLHAAEILYRVLAAGESEPGRVARLANLCEEKHVRVASSVRSDAEDLYTPLLSDARERVQQRLRDEGMLAARQEAIDVIDHTLTFPRWLEGFLIDEHVDGERFWDELMERRRPLDTPFSPVPPDASKDA